MGDLVARSLDGLEYLVEGYDNPLMPLDKIGCDQVILGRKVTVNSGLGDACLLDDRVNADGTNAFFVKKRARDSQDLLRYGVLMGDLSLALR